VGVPCRLGEVFQNELASAGVDGEVGGVPSETTRTRSTIREGAHVFDEHALDTSGILTRDENVNLKVDFGRRSPKRLATHVGCTHDSSFQHDAVLEVEPNDSATHVQVVQRQRARVERALRTSGQGDS